MASAIAALTAKANGILEGIFAIIRVNAHHHRPKRRQAG